MIKKVFTLNGIYMVTVGGQNGQRATAVTPDPRSPDDLVAGDLLGGGDGKITLRENLPIARSGYLLPSSARKSGQIRPGPMGGMRSGPALAPNVDVTRA